MICRLKYQQNIFIKIITWVPFTRVNLMGHKIHNFQDDALDFIGNGRQSMNILDCKELVG